MPQNETIQDRRKLPAHLALGDLGTWMGVIVVLFGMGLSTYVGSLLSDQRHEQSIAAQQKELQRIELAQKEELKRVEKAAEKAELERGETNDLLVRMIQQIGSLKARAEGVADVQTAIIEGLQRESEKREAAWERRIVRIELSAEVVSNLAREMGVLSAKYDRVQSNINDLWQLARDNEGKINGFPQ